MLGDAHLRVLTIVGFPTRDHARDSRRAEPARLSLSLVDAGDHARQDRCDEAADQNPPAMVRQAQVDRGDPEGGDDQRGLGAASTPTPPTRRSMPMPRCRNSAPICVGEAYVTATVTVWDDDPRIADEKLRLVEKVIQGRDFTCMVGDASTRSTPGSARCPATSTPMSGSRRSRRSISPT